MGRPRWEGAEVMGRLGPEGFVEDDPGLFFGALGEWLSTRGCGRPEEVGKGTGNPIATTPVCPNQGFLPHQLPPGFP